MNLIVFLPLVIACAVATPVITDTICMAQRDPIAYATPDGPMPQIEYDFPTPISAPLPGIFSPISIAGDQSKIEYDFPEPISASPPFPVADPATISYEAPIRADQIKSKKEYDLTELSMGALSVTDVDVTNAHSVQPVVQVETMESNVEYAFPAPISAPAPFSYTVPAAPVPIQPIGTTYPVVPHDFQTRIHYAETPVVIGHTSRIMKPNLRAGAHFTGFDFMGLAHFCTILC